MEIVCQEKMKASDIGQVNPSHLQNQRGQECDAVDNQQIFRYSWNTEHNPIYDLSICVLLFCPVWDNFFSFMAQNYENYLFLSPKEGVLQLFFIKKVIFSDFLLFFSLVCTIFAKDFDNNYNFYSLNTFKLTTL